MVYVKIHWLTCSGVFMCTHQGDNDLKPEVLLAMGWSSSEPHPLWAVFTLASIDRGHNGPFILALGLPRSLTERPN